MDLEIQQENRDLKDDDDNPIKYNCFWASADDVV